ncbi:MAG: T9SS type A sorting domain-containing protein [Bacteroidota bacterium]|jgi:hypothetical protein
MKAIISVLFSIFICFCTVAAQTASDYYTPLRTGGYVRLHTTGNIPSGWLARTTIYSFEGPDEISGQLYFREKAFEVMDKNNDTSVFRVFWLRKESAGSITLGAMNISDGSTNIDSATIINVGEWFSNEFLTPGFVRTFPQGDLTSQDSVLSVSETVTGPAGTFTNCLKISDTHFNNVGTAVFREYHYYAQGIGLVKNVRTLPDSEAHTDELVSYGVTVTPVLQEFPIATGPEATIGGGGVFDGNKFLFALLGDASNKYSLGFQFVTSQGIQSGPRISLGKTGSTPLVAFDGTNYLMVWTDSLSQFSPNNEYTTGNIYGQFINTAGEFVGTTLTFATGVNRKFGQGRGGLVFADTTFLLTYLKGGDHIDYLYGQRIGRSGNVLGSPVQISSHYAREQSIAFDGTNYLLAWCKINQPLTDKDIYGQFVSPSGALVGNNFLIDGSDYASDNPVTMTFNGSRYLVLFHDQAADNNGWNLIGRFVTTGGTIAERFTAADSSKNPAYGTAAFDGAHYLITWMESSGKIRVKGRYFTDSGVPYSDPFTVFDTVGNKFPMGGVGGFGNGYFLLTATRIDSAFDNGDVYGMFLKTITTGVREKNSSAPIETFSLFQNYPNPFNPTTVIEYQLRAGGYVTLKIFDLLGREVTTLVNETQHAGDYTVRFDARSLSSGIYFYTLSTGTFRQTNKMMLIR